MRGEEAFKKLVKDYKFVSVLDYGCGILKPHKKPFEDAGKKWYGWDPKLEEHDPDVWSRKYDCVWCCHVLEHILDPIYKLEKFCTLLKDGGILAVTVPPLKNEIVGGHTNLYNAGMLLYHMVLAGIDCREASVRSVGYDVSVIVQVVNDYRRQNDLLYTIGCQLSYDEGDLEILAPYFPEGYKGQGFNGVIEKLNWD